MGRWWVLPASAAAMWAGILVSGPDHPAEAGGRWDGAADAWGLALGGLLLLALAAWAGQPRRSEAAALLGAAGLLQEATEPGPRERILLAAGVPPRRDPISRSPWTPLRAVVLLLGMALLGAGWTSARAQGRGELGGLDGRSVSFGGVAVGDVRRWEYGWSVEAHLERIEPPDGTPRRISLRVWISGGARSPPVAAGMPLAGAGDVSAVPAGSGFGDYLRARGVEAVVEVGRLEVLGPPANPAMRLANAVRDGLRRGATSVLPLREAGLLLGLAIGDTELMDREVEEDFRATGLGHLLAVSGSNVAMFLAPVIGMVIALRLSRGARLTVAVAAVGFFVLLTRWEPSVLRAGAMATLALVGVWTGRPRSTGALLGVAVLLLLVADPGLAASLGFQLSVAATVGLASLASPLAGRLRWMPRPLALAAAATVAAQLAVTPLLLLRFGVVPTATLLANVLAFPAVPLALFAGIAAAGAALAWPPLGHAIGDVAGLPLAYLAGVADRTARLALPSLTSTGWVVPALVGLLVVGIGWRIRRGRRPVGLAVTGLALALVAWSAAPRAGPPSGLEVIFLDVGQGDAAVIRTPDGATVLIDAGPDPQQVATDLAALGIRRIDMVIASHAHADHVEGFPAVLARYPVALVIEPGCPAESPSYSRFLEAIEDEEVPVRHPRGGTTLSVGELVVEVLGPDACFPDSPNDDSLVLRLSHEGNVVLFSGDVEVPAQEDLLEDGDPLTADLLKVPHHGGDTSTAEFFDATGAEVAVVSTGPNDYGHPVPSVLATLERMGMVVVRTDLAGDVTVRFDRGEVLLESERA
jgi:competence protein ComEC